MKPFNMLKMPMILLGLGGALVLSPACKAQEVSPAIFTNTGVEDAYPAAKPKPAATHSRKQQTVSAASAQPAAKRNSSKPSQPGVQMVAEKRKQTPRP